jgi:hypothetical protein
MADLFIYQKTKGKKMTKDSSLKKLINGINEKHHVSLKDTFLDTIDNPEPILRSMSTAAMNWRDSRYDCWELGKELQAKYSGKIPYRAELEVAAGLWYLIYNKKI